MPRTPDLYSRWAREMRQGRLFRAGDRVGVAISGGPDSTLLVFFMKQLAREMGLKLAAVHFNHRLRGAESEADEQFACAQAGQLGIEWVRGEADVAKVAREKHRNLEATARHLRYQFFFSLISQRRVDKVATAHTANDQAETVLLKLLRGAGTRGLAGIYPALEGKIIRPFLNVTRAEVEEELKKRNLDSRLDSSNADTHFQRNKIRKELIPLLQMEFNPEIISRLKDLADRARDDEAFLEEQAHERARPWRVHEGNEDKIPARFLRDLPAAISRRVLRQMILGARGHLRGITYRHIEALRHFAADAQSGRKLMLPGGCEARREFDWFLVAPQPRVSLNSDYSFPITIPGEVLVPQLSLFFRLKIVGIEDGPRAYNTPEGEGFALPEPGASLVLRNWREGDKFEALGSRKARNLKDFFVRRKIPLEQRKLWPVVVCGDHLVWARDYPVAGRPGSPPKGKRVLVSVEKVNSDR